jgi:hypothetical protein
MKMIFEKKKNAYTCIVNKKDAVQERVPEKQDPEFQGTLCRSSLEDVVQTAPRLSSGNTERFEEWKEGVSDCQEISHEFQKDIRPAFIPLPHVCGSS